MEIIARLYNGNKDTKGIYRSAAQYGFEDLIIEPRIVVEENEDTMATAVITEDMLEIIGKTADEVIDEALKNVKGKITNMAEMGMPLPEAEQMTIVTNESMLCGAVAVITMKKEIEKRFPGGYIVLPSSIHEVIIVPRDAGDKDYMVDMVREINSAMVAPEEQLSNNIYEF